MVAGNFGPENFEGHLLGDFYIHCAVKTAHAATADFLDDLVSLNEEGAPPEFPQKRAFSGLSARQLAHFITSPTPDPFSQDYKFMRKNARIERRSFIEKILEKRRIENLMEHERKSYDVDKYMNISYIVSGDMKMVRKTVTIDDDLVKDLEIFAKKEHRDFSGALRYALRIGLLALENPDLTVQEIKDILEAMVDYEMGEVSELDLKDL